MKAVFWYSKHQRELGLARAIAAGAQKCGDVVEMRSMADISREEFFRGTTPVEIADCDAACFVGVKSREWVRRYRAAGKVVVYFDKPYIRRLRGHWRVSVNTHQPTDYIATAQHNPDRWRSFNVRVRSWAHGAPPDSAILICACSAKSFAFNGVGDPTDWATRIVARLRELTNRHIIYRPRRLAHLGYDPIEGTEFSEWHTKLSDYLKRSKVAIVHNSNAGLEAVINGVPTIVLGECVTKPISTTMIEDVEHPRLATSAELRRLFANVAWCQFAEPEFADGLGWRQIRTMIEAAA